MTLLAEIDARLAEHGLIRRGGVDLAADDQPPAGTQARAVVLVGNAGSAYWKSFSRWRAGQASDLADPLDTWSRCVLDAIAADMGARVLMPNDRPYAPFQRWAMRAEGLRPSPLGILMHPAYGLWHAYRGALLFDHPLAIRNTGEAPHACDSCLEKPCIAACPVAAFDGAGFAYERCLDHVRGPDGARCRDRGCMARNACPVGVQWRYGQDTQAFHQRAFAGIGGIVKISS